MSTAKSQGPLRDDRRGRPRRGPLLTSIEVRVARDANAIDFVGRVLGRELNTRGPTSGRSLGDVPRTGRWHSEAGEVRAHAGTATRAPGAPVGVRPPPERPRTEFTARDHAPRQHRGDGQPFARMESNPRDHEREP